MFDEPAGPGSKVHADQLENDVLPPRREGMTDDELELDDFKQLLEAPTMRRDDAHPAVVKALQRSSEIPETHTMEGYLSESWIANRSLNLAKRLSQAMLMALLAL